MSLINANKFEVLKQYFGYDTFREGQEWIVDHLLSKKDVVGVMPTGAGKSLCFQVPAMLFDGITLVISPLISLMKDQVTTLNQAGIKSAYINSSLTARQAELAMENARKGVYKIIYIAPERLLTDSFVAFAKSTPISMVTVDEAHCISQWGQDFRPSYVKISEFIDLLDHRPIVSAFTATATLRVREDIVQRLGLRNEEIFVSGFNRPNLFFEMQKPSDKFKALTSFLADKHDKSGIIYCSTRKTVDEVCDKLDKLGFQVAPYHAGLTDRERTVYQDDFIYDRKNIIVATNAFGMGIDKSNVSYVVHYNMPKDMESYYQEAGRAGRDGVDAHCLLLYSGQDVRTNSFLIESSKDTVYENDETEQMIKERARKRLQSMTFYCHTQNCLREYILKYFGDKPTQYCGNCSNCNENFEKIDISIDAKKILSCMKRANESYGMRVIIDILRGSKNERILRLGFDKLKTYGIMKEVAENRIRDIIHFLVLNEYAYITADEFPILKLTEKSHEILFSDIKLEIKLPKEAEHTTLAKAKNSPSAKAVAVNPELLEQLKKVRLTIANTESVPAFVVFSDATLIDMCMKLPKNDAEFLDVSGVGQVKLTKYGASFLQQINSFLSDTTAPLTQSVTLKTIETEKDLEEFYTFLENLKTTLHIPDELVTLSAFVDLINVAVMQHYHKKIVITKLTKWLLANDFLENIVDETGTHRNIPTAKGIELGIVVQQKTSKNGDSYPSNAYTQKAQAFMLDSVVDMYQFMDAL